MPRVRKGGGLDSREARRELKVRPEPYWCRIEPGLFLGYRKSGSGGVWIERRATRNSETGKTRYLERALALADDFRDPDGEEVLTFAMAQRKLLREQHEKALGAAGGRTVREAAPDYVEYMRQHRKSATDTEARLRAYLTESPLADKRLADLTAADLDAWLAWALKRRRKLRGKAQDGAQNSAPDTEGSAKAAASERQRRRKSTVNRIVNSVKACLRRAGAPDVALKRLQKFRAVDSARTRWLTVDEARRIQNAASPDLRALIGAALQTGCRAGELLAAQARDFDAESRTLLIADSKSGKPRRIPLTDEGAKHFEQLIAGKREDERLFLRADGSSWYRVALVRAMRAACKAGKVRPAATFHTLRHSYASHLVKASVPLAYVAEVLGHADVRMIAKHYGHLQPSHVAETVRAALPSFGVPSDSNVTDLRSRHV